MKRWRAFAAALMALMLLVSAAALGEGAADAREPDDLTELIASGAVEASPGEQAIPLGADGAQANAAEAPPAEERPFTLTPGEKRKEPTAANVNDALILRVDGATVTKWKASPAKAIKSQNSGTDGQGDYTAFTLGQACKKLTLTATLTGAANKKKSASLTIAVLDPYIPTGIEFTDDMPASVPFGATLDLDGKAAPTPAWADPEITWKVSGAAKLDKKTGLLTTTKAGTAKVTATAAKNKKASKTFPLQVTPNKVQVGHGAPGPEDIAEFAGSWSLWLDSVEYTKKGLVCAFYVLNGTGEKSTQIANLNLRLCVGSMDNEVASKSFSKVSAAVPPHGSKLVKITLPVHAGVAIPELAGAFVYFEADPEAKLKGKKNLYPYTAQKLPDFPEDPEDPEDPQNLPFVYSKTIDNECWIEGVEDDVETLEIPEEIEGLPVVRVNNEAFKGKTALRRVTLPEGLQSIGNNAFEDFANLERVNIPSTVTILGTAAFRGCSRLGSVALPDGLATIPWMGFMNCAALTEARLPANLEEIADSAFSGCVNLASLALPDRLTQVGARAFSGCGSLNTVHIPASLTSIGVDAFGFCASLTTITVASDNPTYGSIDGALYTGSGTDPYEFVLCPAGKSGIFQIAEGTKKINARAFGGCEKLTSVRIAESVGEILKEAFIQCHGLTSVVIPQNVAALQAGTFTDCKELYEITLRSASTQLTRGFCTECPKFRKVRGPSPSYAQSWVETYGKDDGISFEPIGE